MGLRNTKWVGPGAPKDLTQAAKNRCFRAGAETALSNNGIVPGVDLFLAPCSKALAAAVPDICQDASGLDRAAFHHNFNQSVVGFFNKELTDR
jgi:hypothetical protein